MRRSNKENAKIFKAFSDETRLNILELLKNGEKCACSLLEELNVVQSTLSHHMKILCDSAVVTARKDGKWSYYSLSKEGATAVKSLLDFYTSADGVKDQCSCNSKPL